MTDQLFRIKQVLEILPIGRSTWWEGVRSGVYPEPIKLGPRTTCWRSSEVHAVAQYGLDWRRALEG